MRHRAGFSVLELTFVVIICGVLLYAIYSMFGAGRRMEDTLSAHLGMQADARKALMEFIRELQESMAVVRPAPGNTLSYAIVRDKLSRLTVYTAAPGGKPGELVLQRDTVSPAGNTRTRVLDGLYRVAFTATSDRALSLHLLFGEGERRMAFHTQVRLRNRDAAETF